MAGMPPRWWKHDEAWERYDYLYSPAELEEWRPAILELSAQAKTTFVFLTTITPARRSSTPGCWRSFWRLLDETLG